jgi:microcystin degradation protein MlrC
VAVGGILTECNQLGGLPIDRSWFERYELRHGGEVLGLDSGVMGGMLQVLRERQAEAAPLLFASTCPGGVITSACYGQLRSELLERLRVSLPVDGVLLAMHGAAVAEGVDDVEGDLVQATRAVVGPGVPIVGTLDLHAHVTAAMVEGADALLAWETYPHRDTLETGQRAARLLTDALAGRLRPRMAMAKVPVITSALRGSTEWDDPFGRVMRFAKGHEGRGSIASVSVLMVHPPLDQPGLGSGGLAIADDDLDAAVDLARRIARMYWELRFELEPPVHTPEEAIAEGLRQGGGPIVLVESADCCGGGAAGDGVATLKALLAAQVAGPALVPVADPAAAAACHRAGVGGRVRLSLGHHLDPRWGTPVEVEGRVARLGDGRFRYRGGIWDGVVGEMGPSAVVEIGGLHALVTTHATYDWLDEQFRALGLDPATAQFVVVKNPMNYRMAYGDAARAVYLLDTPGPTPATYRRVQRRRTPRPYFPLDQEIPGLEPTVHTNRRVP